MTQSIAQQTNETAAQPVMELYAQKARLLLQAEPELLSAGMSGVVQVSFTCSEDWAGLKKTAVFTNGIHRVDVPEETWQGNVCTVPQQVLAVPGKTVSVGLYGTDCETLVLPTVWCTLGRVEPGAVPSGSIALPPEAPIWAQLQKQLGEVAAAAPFVVQVLSQQPGDNDTVTVILDHSFPQIKAAYQEGHLVVMEMSGGFLPLTRLISGTRAEFTGAVFTTGGNAFYSQCIVPQTGDAFVETIPIGGEGAGTALTVRLSRDGTGALYSDTPITEICTAARAGIDVQLVNDNGQILCLAQADMTQAQFTGVVWNPDSGEFHALSYFLQREGITEKREALLSGNGYYQKPAGGIPSEDLSPALSYKIGSYVVVLTKTDTGYRSNVYPSDIRNAVDQGADVVLYDSGSGMYYRLIFANVFDAFFGGVEYDPGHPETIRAALYRISSLTAWRYEVSLADAAAINTLLEGKLDTAKLTEAVDTALAKAKESGAFDGAAGAAGKSAYQYAKEGGYSGTEQDFAGKLAKDLPEAFYVNITGEYGEYEADKTLTEVYEAFNAGRPVYCRVTFREYDGYADMEHSYTNVVCTPFVFDGENAVFSLLTESVLATIVYSTDYISLQAIRIALWAEVPNVSESWTFELEDGTTVKKRVALHA